MVKDRIILERRFVPKGTVIIKQADEGYSAYLIQSGEVKIYVFGDDGKEIELARLGAGQICGEMALIDDNVRSANVKVSCDANLIVITRSAFEEKLAQVDTTIQAVMHMLIKRIKSSNCERIEMLTNSASHEEEK